MAIHIQDGFTALHACSQQGHSEVVKMLLMAKADVNFKAIVSATVFLTSDSLLIVHVLCKVYDNCIWFGFKAIVVLKLSHTLSHYMR